MNIMINTYCNLKCPYCFADNEISTCSDKNMSMENFELIIKNHKRNNRRMVRIIGGEPTIHPNFEEFLYKVAEDEFFHGVHFFSNMTFDSDILDTILTIADYKRISVLPNFNSKGITKEKFDLIKKNIKILSRIQVVESLGINLYDPGMDLNYFFDLLKETNIKNARWVIVSPNQEIGKEFDVKKHFNSFYNKLIEFFDRCIELGVEPNMDCSDIPICSFTKEQQSELILRCPEMFSRSSCDIVLDINPKMEVFRCFGMSEYFKTKLKETTKIETLLNVIGENTKEFVDKLLFNECKECPRYKKFGKSCGCVVYRAKAGEVNE